MALMIFRRVLYVFQIRVYGISMKILEDDTHLIHAAKNGQEGAFESLYIKYSIGVFALAQKILKNKADAEDARQETFLVVLTKIQSFDERSGFYAWIYAITSRICLKILRRNKYKDYTVFYAYNDSQHVIDPEHIVCEASSLDHVKLALTLLPKQQRSSIEYRLCNEYTYRDIGIRLGCSENSARSNAFFGLKKLRDHFTYVA